MTLASKVTLREVTRNGQVVVQAYRDQEVTSLSYASHGVEAFVALVRKHTATWDDVQIEVEADDAYGDIRGYLRATGWSAATKEEIRIAAIQEAEQAAVEQRLLDSAEKRLRAKRPDLFKEQS